MADIYEINRKFGISIKKLKSMERDGCLKTTKPENPDSARMQCTLRKGNRLSAIDLVCLIENNDLIYNLGDYDFVAREQVEALGDAKSEAAKPIIATVIDLAAKDQPKEVEALEQWMKRIIPSDREVCHHYLAVRALLGVSTNLRRYVAGSIPRAFLNVRAKPSFSCWFTQKETRYARRATFYQRPDFDL